MEYKTYKITKITKGIIKNYIKFELNGDVEFSNGKHNFIFCPNEFPFRNYQVKDGIEINLTNAKDMSSQSYHQGLIEKVYGGYIEENSGDYGTLQGREGGSRNKLGTQSKQDSITLSAYEAEATYDFLYGALEWLELYIEKENPNWQQKKQLPKTITRPDIPYLDAKEVRGHFSTSLTGLRVITSGKPQFLLEKLQTEFFSWLDNSGINVNECSTELMQSLVDFHSILIGKGGDFAKRRRKETDENIAKMTAEERKKGFYEIVAAYQEPLENEDKVFETMKGQTYRDVNNNSKFVGSADKGEEIFKHIKKQQEISQREVVRQRELEYLNRGDDMEMDESASSSSPARSSNQTQGIRWDLIISIEQNKNDWEIRKEVITYNHYDGEKKGDVLILKTAKIDNRDYNQATGELINQPRKVYRQDYFNEKELAEINAIFDVSSSTSQANQEIRLEIVNDIKQRIDGFKIEKFFVPNRRGGFDQEDWIVHSLAERKSDENGGLIFDSKNMYKVKDLTEAEKQAIGYNKSESSLQNSVVSTIPKNNDDNSVSTGKVLGIIGVISAVIIASVIVVKKQLNKKIKK